MERQLLGDRSLIPGWNYALAVFVNQENPISKMTVQRLDGIFGTERDGGSDASTQIVVRQRLHDLDGARLAREHHLALTAELAISSQWRHASGVGLAASGRYTTGRDRI